MTKALTLFRARAIRVQDVPISDLVARQLALKSARTREAYGNDLRQFAAFTGCVDVPEACQRLAQVDAVVAQDVVLAFQADLLARGLAPGTVNRRIAALRSVLKIARGVGLTTVRLELVDHLDPEAEARDVRGPGIEVLRHIVAVCDADGTPAGIRDATIVRWLLATGVRRNELRSLTMADYRPDRGGAATIMVKQKRKRRKHPILLTPSVVQSVQPWLAVRGTGRGALFPSLSHRVRRNQLLGPTGLNQIVRRRAIQAGFPNGKLPDGRSITPHGVRHTAITEVMRRYGAAAAQAFARHSDPATTQMYNDAKDTMAVEGQSFVFDLL